ncbi:hypothetical protein VPH35_013306 [Triticum aestivum]
MYIRFPWVVKFGGSSSSREVASAKRRSDGCDAGCTLDDSLIECMSWLLFPFLSTFPDQYNIQVHTFHNACLLIHASSLLEETCNNPVGDICNLGFLGNGTSIFHHIVLLTSW